MAISTLIDSNEFIVLFVGVTTTVPRAKAKRHLLNHAILLISRCSSVRPRLLVFDPNWILALVLT